MRWLWNRKGQNILEYALLIVVVLSALLVVQFYVGRAVQGKGKSSFDGIGQQYSAGHTPGRFTITIEPQVNVEQFGEDAIGGQGHSLTTSSGARTTTEGYEEITWGLGQEGIWDR